MMGPLNYCPPHTPGGDLRERGRYWFKALAVKLHGGARPRQGLCGAGKLECSAHLARPPALRPKGRDRLRLFWDPKMVS